MQDILLAGPYELTRKIDSKEKLTLCITSGYEISSRKYVNGKPVNTRILAHAKDFDSAMADLEAIIAGYKADYDVKGEDKDGPSTIPTTLIPKPQVLKAASVLGKRPLDPPAGDKAVAADPAKPSV